jgi:hypothetical protein
MKKQHFELQEGLALCQKKKRLKKQGDFKNDFNICIKFGGFVLQLAQQGFPKKKALIGQLIKKAPCLLCTCIVGTILICFFFLSNMQKGHFTYFPNHFSS